MAIQRDQISEIVNEQFLFDVNKGLEAQPKKLSSKYFYDDVGSKLFESIMSMPEYYLTGCEYEIMSTQAERIATSFGELKELQVIELGAGNGLKAIPLLKGFQKVGLEIEYCPIDVSSQALNNLEKRLLQEMPQLSYQLVQGDYFTKLENLVGEKPTLLLYLGSNIGNYNFESAQTLTSRFGSFLKLDDFLLIGFDLQKEPNKIAAAYDDPAGITAQFNLNLLTRMNRELGANFLLDQFGFYSHYNPKNGEVNSFLVSLRDQSVNVNANGETYHFERNELIHTEIARKYDLDEIENLSKSSVFHLQSNFLDCKHYFVDSLWQKNRI